MGKLIQIDVELWLDKVSAPAADFQPEAHAFVEVEMLGKTASTTDIALDFPLVFGQRITFKRTYRHATIMRAVEHLYRDRLSVRLLRRGSCEKDGQVVARYDGTTGNALLNGNVDNSEEEDAQALELRTCVEGFCFRPRLKFTSHVTIRELATCDNDDSPKEASEGAAGCPAKEDKCSDWDQYETAIKKMEKIVEKLQPEAGGKSANANHGPNDQAGTCEYAEDDKNGPRPPFVVRHVDDKLFGRTPKLHRTMSQDTDAMLIQHKLDHPSDCDIQKVEPGNVPVKVYWKLRREYERNHNIKGSKGQAPQSAKASKKRGSPKLAPIKEKPENRLVGRENQTIMETVVKKKMVLTDDSEINAGIKGRDPSRDIASKTSVNCAQQTEDDSSNDADYYDDRPIADPREVRVFAKKSTGCRADAANSREVPASKNYARQLCEGNIQSNLYGGGDDTEMAAVYRDFTRTLQRDRAKCQNYDNGSRQNESAECSPWDRVPLPESRACTREERRRCKKSQLPDGSFSLERDMLCSMRANRSKECDSL